MKFSKLEIKNSILCALSDMKFEEMTEIQEQTIPAILKGRNIIGEARTGTGKTAAFAIPILEKIDVNKNHVQAVIMSPTRELALQIVDEFKKLAKYEKVSILPIVGGMSMSDQIKRIKTGAQIIVATPGRLVDHLNRKRINLKETNFFVIDEVDEMLKAGFIDDINLINNHTNNDKQSLLFSATISKSVLSVASNLMNDYEFISVSKGDNTKSSVKQYAVVLKENQKFSALLKLLAMDNPELAIIFGRTKRRVDELMEALTNSGYQALALHGDLNQGQRNVVMRKFKNGDINILVATDVAARGIDVNNVTHVYNFDLPQEIEFYVHRVGRTGRADKTGVSYSFIKEVEMPHLERIMKETKSTIKIVDLPTSKNLSDASYNKLIKKIDDTLANRDITLHEDNIKQLIETYGANKLVGCLIELNSNKKKINDIKLTGEPPVRVKPLKKGGHHGKRTFKRRR